MDPDRGGEEPGRRFHVTLGRDVHVDDLTMLVDRAVHVPPGPGHLHAGLVDEPPIPDRVAARPGRIDDQRSEPLHPPIQGDVIDLDPTLGQQLLEVPVGQAVPQVPANRQQDHLWREPEPCERPRPGPEWRA